MDNNEDAPRSTRRKRPRGAPRGNQNARKHRLYSPHVAAGHTAADYTMALREFSQALDLLRFRLRPLLRDPDPTLYQISEVLTDLGRAFGVPDNYWYGR